MLRIYSVLLELVRSLRPLLRELERRDPDLARQCRRALCSAPLNVAEGSYNRGKNRAARYHTALGSLREVLACLEVAAALGYLPDVDPGLRRRFDHAAPKEGLRQTTQRRSASGAGEDAGWRSHAFSSRQNRAPGTKHQRDGISEPPGEQ
jgi:four helix bundle protein